MSQPFLFDMETSDPDDVFALALLASHPRANLVGVTIHPGGADQVGVVRHVLRWLGRSDVPVGALLPKDDKRRVSAFHYTWLGKLPPAKPDGTPTEVIRAALERAPDVHLVTGAALTNIANAWHDLRPRFFRKWTCQGGFAGDKVVPPSLRLQKFAGRITCPTFNLNGNPKAAEELLGDRPIIEVSRLVSKNVCHGVFWTPEVNERVPAAHPGLFLIREGMSVYFRKHREGKALHDVIAAVAALSPEIGTWVPVVPYRSGNEWGSRPDPASSVEIMIGIDRMLFERCLAV